MRNIKTRIQKKVFNFLRTHGLIIDPMRVSDGIDKVSIKTAVALGLIGGLGVADGSQLLKLDQFKQRRNRFWYKVTSVTRKCWWWPPPFRNNAWVPYNPDPFTPETICFRCANLIKALKLAGQPTDKIVCDHHAPSSTWINPENVQPVTVSTEQGRIIAEMNDSYRAQTDGKKFKDVADIEKLFTQYLEQKRKEAAPFSQKPLAKTVEAASKLDGKRRFLPD